MDLAAIVTLRKEDGWEFEAILGYTVRSKTATVTF